MRIMMNDQEIVEEVFEKESMKPIRVVIIFKDKTQMAGDLWIKKKSRISDYVNFSDRSFIPLSNVTYEGKDLPVFLANMDDIRGILPVE